MKNTKGFVAMTVIVGLVMISGLGYAKAKKVTGGVVNINTAGLSELMALPGIGQSKAQAIVDYRKDHPFQKPADLKEVKGIGEKRFAVIEQYIVVSGESTITAGTPSSGPAALPATKLAPGDAERAF